MPKVPNLIRKHNTFYIRLRVPQDIVDSFGKNEVVKSLKTTDYKQACQRINIERLKINTEFTEFRQRLESEQNQTDMLSSYSEYDLEALSLRWMDEKEREINNSSSIEKLENLDENERRDYLDDLEMEHHYAKAEANGRRETELHQGKDAAIRFLKKNKISFDRKSKAFDVFASYISKANYEMTTRRLRYYQGRPYKPTHAMFVQPALSAQISEATQDRGITLGRLIQEYINDPSKHREDTTLKNYRVIFRALEEFFGKDKSLEHIKRSEVKALREVLLSLPANASKKAPNSTLQEACDLAVKKGWSLVSTSTVNMYLEKLNSLFKYAHEEGYISSNPAKGLRIKEHVKKKNKRNSFGFEQLNQIFNAPLF